MSALVPYKRLDIAIDACARTGASLRILGDGPLRSELERHGAGRVEFVGWQSREQLRLEYQRAAAVLLPGEEDFGIVPVEAQACGCPVVALARGGALETVRDGETGVLVREAGAEAFAKGLDEVQRARFDSARLRANAERFSRARHIERMKALIDETLAAPPGQRW